MWLQEGGACVVAGGVGHAWLQGGMHGCTGGHAWLLLGGCAWLLGGCMVAPGGVSGSSGGVGGGVRGFFHEIRSMSGRYASYWNAFLLVTVFVNNFCLKLIRTERNSDGYLLVFRYKLDEVKVLNVEHFAESTKFDTLVER